MAEPQTVAGPCPKCGYVRTPQDRNPSWQCPNCHIAYAKFQARAATPIARFAVEGREMAERAGHDSSLAALIAANVLALAVAYATRMTLHQLMLVYWIQSVIIGLMNVYRILNLDRFATDGFTMNDKPVDEVPSTKRQAASFFVVHYGGFHAGYLIFILSTNDGKLGAPGGYALCALAFFVSHAFSLRHNLESDARGRPNIAALMFLPYARVLPMHFIIMIAGVMAAPLSGSGTGVLLLFGVLKTVADAVMHTVGHHIMGRSHGRAADG